MYVYVYEFMYCIFYIGFQEFMKYDLIATKTVTENCIMHFVLHSQQFEPSKKVLTEVLARQFKLLCFAVSFCLSCDFMMILVLPSHQSYLL